jgi:hypothetical protein
MKLSSLRSYSFALILGLSLAGCKKETSADATQPLENSFQQAEPAVKQTITAVNTSLKSGDYAQAMRTLAPVVTGRPLTEPQKQAVGIALQQINNAIAKDPSLDSKEMYELRAKMFRAVHGGSRF